MENVRGTRRNQRHGNLQFVSSYQELPSSTNWWTGTALVDAEVAALYHFWNHPSGLEAGKLEREADKQDLRHAILRRRFGLLGERLAIPMDVHPGEGLADLLYRAAAENGYTTTAILNKIGGIPLSKRLTPQSLSKEKVDLVRFANILATPNESDLNRLGFGQGVLAARTLFFGRELHRANFRSTRAIAPRSLVSACYQKAIWSVRALTFDPKTFERLLTECPKCKRPLDFYRTYAVERCALCREEGREVDFRDFPQELISVDDQESINFVTSLIDPEVAVRDLMIPEPLHSFGPGQLFELIVGMACLVGHAETDHAKFRGSGIKNSIPTPENLSIAGRAILGWPNSLFDYADKLLKVFEAAFPEFRLSRRPHPVTLIDRAIDERLRGLVTLTLGERLWFRKADQSVRRMIYCEGPNNERSRAGKGLTRNGGLTSPSNQQSSPPVTPSAPCGPSISKAFRRTSRLLGIPIIFLRPLLHEGRELAEADRGASRHLSSEVRRRANISKNAVPLDTLCALLSKGIGNPWPSLLEALANGVLNFELCSDSSGPLMSRLYVTEYAEVETAMARSKRIDHCLTHEMPWGDIAKIYGVSENIVYLLRRQGVLSHKATLAEVFKVREDTILISEVQKRLAMKGDYTTADAAAAELKAAGIPSWAQSGAYRTSVRQRGVVEEYFGGRLYPRVDMSRHAP